MQSKSRLGHHSLAGIDSGSTAPRLRRAALLRLLAVVGILGAGAVLPTAAAGEPGAIPFVQVRIDQVTPQVATTTSEPVVTVTGTVANIGDRPVRDVMIRLEHAPAVSNSAGLRTNLDGGTDQYQAAEDFVTVSPELRRGQKTKFTLSAPMRSATKHSLDINAPGVYPLLVNVNGTPDYGEPARLDNARFLLPVVGVPADPLDTSGQALGAMGAVGRTRYLQTRTGHHAVAAGRPAPAGARRAGRHHPGPADGR